MSIEPTKLVPGGHLVPLQQLESISYGFHRIAHALIRIGKRIDYLLDILYICYSKWNDVVS